MGAGPSVRFGVRPSSAVRRRPTTAAPSATAAPTSIVMGSVFADKSSIATRPATAKTTASGRPMSAYTFTSEKVSTHELLTKSASALRGSAGRLKLFTVSDAGTTGTSFRTAPSSSTPASGAGATSGSFKSNAIILEVELSEALKHVGQDTTDQEENAGKLAVFQVFRRAFDAVIDADAVFGPLLRRIKTAYETLDVKLDPKSTGDELRKSYDVLLRDYGQARAQLAEMQKMLQAKLGEAESLVEENALLQKRVAEKNKEVNLMSDRFHSTSDVFIQQKRLARRIKEVEAAAHLAASVGHVHAARTSDELHLPPHQQQKGRSAGSRIDGGDHEFVEKQLRKDLQEISSHIGVVRLQEQDLVEKFFSLRKQLSELTGTPEDDLATDLAAQGIAVPMQVAPAAKREPSAEQKVVRKQDGVLSPNSSFIGTSDPDSGLFLSEDESDDGSGDGLSVGRRRSSTEDFSVSPMTAPSMSPDAQSPSDPRRTVLSAGPARPILPTLKFLPETFSAPLSSSSK